MTEIQLEIILWAVVIVANVAAYYYDYFMNQKIEGEDEDLI